MNGNGSADPVTEMLRSRQVRWVVEEYELELAAYDTWIKAWLARQPKGFRAKRSVEENAPSMRGEL